MLWPGVPTAVTPGATSVSHTIARDAAAERVEHAAIVVEQLGHAALRGAAHLAVIHPERPLGLRHLDLGVRKRRLVVGQ